MNSTRIWVVILISWLAFLFNIERIITTINIHSYTYVFILVLVIFVPLLPGLRKLSLTILSLNFTILFVLLKLFWHQEAIFGAQFPLTVTQISAIILTALIARQINQRLSDLETTITNISLNNVGKPPLSFEETQGVMYAEVVRARRYERPLSIVALKFDDDSLDVAFPKIVTEIQQSMVKQYVISTITAILDKKLEDFDTIALYNNYFLTVLPEMTTEEACAVAAKLEQAVNEKLEISLQLGTANYPTDASTFEGLVATAITNADKKKLSDQTQSQQTPPQISP